MYKEMVDPSERMKLLRNKINDAVGYLAVTPEYNHSTSRCLGSTNLLYQLGVEAIK
jgi:NAD(P)H-dependent FMN reductase